MNAPKVSIIIATFNREKYFSETLQSIKNQTFSDFECLIIDDGSTDNTKKIVSNFILTDSRFKYSLRNSSYSKGTSGSRNNGLDLAKGEYFIFFDDDDIVHPLNLEICNFELDLNKEIAFCKYERAIFFDDFHYNFDLSTAYQKKEIGERDLEKILKNEIPINSCSVMWRSQKIHNQRFNENISFGDEWEFYSRIISNNLQGIAITKTLFFGRKHRNSITTEFHQNDPIRRKSYVDAVLLVIANLLSKKRLSYSILRYFVAMSYNFREFLLFESILDKAKLTFLKKIYWRFFFLILPLRLIIHKLKQKIFNNKL